MTHPYAVRPGKRNLITDVRGLKLGNAQDRQAITGVSVLLPDESMTAAADISGGAPGTRETDALEPTNLVEAIHGIVLAGGSAFGLDAASSVVNWLGAQGKGFCVLPGAPSVPVVPGAILFDLANGGDKSWGATPPYAALGIEAAQNASEDFALGNAGAGYGAQAGQLKGGLGSASALFEHENKKVTVAALVAVNSIGSPVEPVSGALWAAPFALSDDEREGIAGRLPRGDGAAMSPLHNSKWDAALGANTTIAVIATDANLGPLALKRIAMMAHDGLARAIRPIHTSFDGDSIFAVATGYEDVAEDAFFISLIGSLGADCLSRAVLRGILAAQSLAGMKSYKNQYEER